MPALGSVEEEEMMFGACCAPPAPTPDKNRNPNVHPRDVRISSPALHVHARLTEKAQAYFMWEPMNGTPKEELMQDEYWTYMEEQHHAA